MHSELPADTALVGIAARPEFELFQFAQKHRLPYPILAEAEPLMDAYGIDLIWGSVFYLIDPEGRVLAADLEPSVAAAHAAGP
ncbi:MAG: peroxiredoxin family protein [Planctomycetota bacterium]